MCGGNISYTHIVMSGGSAQPSSLLGGETENKFYVCDLDFDVCTVSVSVYASYVASVNNRDRNIYNSKDWRDALSRYNHYVTFMSDNIQLKTNIMLMADDDLRINSDWSYLCISA